MNIIVAKVTNIEPGEVVSFIQLESAGIKLRVIKSQLPIWLSVGDTVQCEIHEASVCISKECPGKVSIENRISARLKDIRTHDSLCELTLESDMGEVVALITELAFDELDLKKECEATMLMRGIDLSIEPHIDSLQTLKLRERVTRIKDAN